MAESQPPLALVTGAQQGIGEAIACALSQAGYDIVVADISTALSGDELAARWGTPRRVVCLQCDISDPQQAEQLFDRIEQTFDRPAVCLVNNAAVQFWASLLDLSVDDWNQTLRVNLTGTFVMTQQFARRRKRVGGEGVIINLGSGCNQLAFPNLVSYTASKGGIEMLTKAAALELGALGIRVNCIAPGAIETERTRSETATYAESWSPLTPLNRVGEVSDVADAVVALASDAMRFVSGQTLNVDGGLFSRAVWPREY